MTCISTGALGEYSETGTALQCLSSLVVGGLHLFGTTLINENLVGLGTSKAYKRNLTQLVFHHPFEMAMQMTINQEDIESTLMVGHEDIRLFLVQMLTPLYTYRDKE